MPNTLQVGLHHFDMQLESLVREREEKFLEEMLRWNKRVNLTAIRDYGEAVEKHLLDSLILIRHLKGKIKLLDIGSGGGLPGIPLAIAAPSLQVVSVDSVGKKTNFQKHVKRTLQLDNLLIIPTRIEELGQFGIRYESFDVVVSRAFSSLENFLVYAAPWLRSGGRAVAMKGPEGRDELLGILITLEQLGYAKPVVIDYVLPFSGAKRLLVVLEKK